MFINDLFKNNKMNEGFDELDAYMKDKLAPKPRGGAGVKQGTYGQPNRRRGRPAVATGGQGSSVPQAVDFDRPHSERSAGRRLPRYSDDYDANFRREVDEGSVQDRLHRRHQELRKKSGLPDPDYYKELKASYDIEDDAKRIAAQAEIKKKYKVAEANVKKPQPFNNDTAAKTYASLKPSKNPVKENTGVTKHNDYDRWSDEVAAAGGEIHPQRDRVRMVAQSWDGETIGEFHMGTNQGWLMSHGQQGVAEDVVPNNMPAINTGQVELSDKYFKALKQRAEEDGRELDTSTLNVLRAKAQDAASNKLAQPQQPQQQPTQQNKSNYPTQGSERRVAQDFANFESVNQGMAEGVEQYLEEMRRAGYDIVTERATLCPECGGVAYEDKMLAEKQDACYHKVKSRYKVWPSAYASGALVRCRKVGAKNWGNKSKK
jgi:hypothetical protein